MYARVVSIAVFHLMLTTPAHLVTQFFARAHAGVCSFLAGFGLPPPDPERIKRETKYSARRLAGYVIRIIRMRGSHDEAFGIHERFWY